MVHGRAKKFRKRFFQREIMKLISTKLKVIKSKKTATHSQ